MQKWPEPPPQGLARLVLAIRRRLRIWLDSAIPELTVFEDSLGAAVTQLLGAVVRHRIPDRLQAGSRTAASLAEELDLHADSLHRAMRGLVYRGYFRLSSDGRFSNSRLSRALISNRPDSNADFPAYFSSASNVAAWGTLEHVLKHGGSGFQEAHGCSVWQWFTDHPEEEATFARAMHSRTFSDAPLVANLYPFQEVASVCDVAGGRGGLLSEIAIRHPHLQATLFDVPGVLQEAEGFLRERGLEGRIELCSGNFFTRVPAGRDLYLLKNILHDWDDAACVTILSNCAQAMPAQGRLLIVEFLVERNLGGQLGAVTDLQMMVVLDRGRERSQEEFATLLRSAGLRLTGVQRTASVGLLEARKAS